MIDQPCTHPGADEWCDTYVTTGYPWCPHCHTHHRESGQATCPGITPDGEVADGRIDDVVITAGEPRQTPSPPPWPGARMPQPGDRFTVRGTYTTRSRPPRSTEPDRPSGRDRIDAMAAALGLLRDRRG